MKKKNKKSKLKQLKMSEPFRKKEDIFRLKLADFEPGTNEQESRYRKAPAQLRNGYGGNILIIEPQPDHCWLPFE